MNLCISFKGLSSTSLVDRDVFRTFYWRALAKRLLLQKSASDDFEKAVIKKLRDGTFFVFAELMLHIQDGRNTRI